MILMASFAAKDSFSFRTISSTQRINIHVDLILIMVIFFQLNGYFDHIQGMVITLNIPNVPIL